MFKVKCATLLHNIVLISFYLYHIVKGYRITRKGKWDSNGLEGSKYSNDFNTFCKISISHLHKRFIY